jgi:hypothetical protein
VQILVEEGSANGAGKGREGRIELERDLHKKEEGMHKYIAPRLAAVGCVWSVVLCCVVSYLRRPAVAKRAPIFL